jgi:hypothetical protein
MTTAESMSNDAKVIVAHARGIGLRANGEDLGPGDGAILDEQQHTLERGERAEFVLWELPGRA